MAAELKKQYNPDVLTCLANLSNDEVFTPPELVNQMLDFLPAALWQNKHARFLDPVTKSGVFLREIAKRLNEGLKTQIPDQQARIDHIFTRQLYGVAITELTSLLARRSVYCSKTANGQYSICRGFTNTQGNIRYQPISHTWQNGKCRFCGASQEVYDREIALESHAYEFIHTDNPASIFGKDMKFDVIIGNPPYQLSDGGGSGSSARPIYQWFVDQAKKLQPAYLLMIIPARWYSGGKGLDQFRTQMLSDQRMKVLVDFEHSSEVFPGVDVAGGICYFLWEKDHSGLCRVINAKNGIYEESFRALDEFAVFIRNAQAISIIHKVWNAASGLTGLNQRISKRQPFGIPTTYAPTQAGIPCWFTQKLGLLHVHAEDIADTDQLLDKWKLLIAFAPIAGQTDFSKPIKFYSTESTRIAKPGECCSETWLVACAFDTEQEVINFKSYLFTKTVRFLLLQHVISQNITRRNFSFIPDLGDYKTSYTDALLMEMWSLSADEWAYI